jgi:hypothetical protein
VSTTPATFPVAPLDRAARLVTRGLWLGGPASAAIGAVLLVARDSVPGAVLVAVGASIAAITWYLDRIRPVEYVLEDGGFVVLRRHARPKRFVGGSRDARRGRLGLRIAGDGGGYGYLGRFRAEGRTVHAFVTDRDRVVLLDVGDASLAVSPADPEEFLAEVSRAA